LRGALGVTLLGAVVPGAGLLWAGRLVGYLFAVPWVAGVVYLMASTDIDSMVELASDPARLRSAAVGLGVGLGLWMLTVVATYVLVRPVRLRVISSAVGIAVVLIGCVTAGLPVVQAMRYAGTQADLVETVFTGNRTATAPRDVTPADPWGGRDRVNVLLLGGDGSIGRTGVRTDTVLLLSMNTNTGRSVMFSLPRNMMNAQFPEDSPLHEVFPEGFSGSSDASNWMLNAVYGQVPALYPGILGDSENEGADALKQAVGGSLGLRVDYYVLVNLLGFRQVVDALGGVTVNVNEPVAIGGDTDRGIPPSDYLDPGPDQHLDGFHALWFARGRWGSDDYARMLRQRCLVNALIDEADPVTVLRRYLDLAKAGQEIVRTDVPRSLLPAFVDLALKVKGHPVRSIAFVRSDRFFSGAPDFAWMQESVRRALQAASTAEPAEPGSAAGGPTPESPPTPATPSASPTPTPGTPTPGPTVAPDPGVAVDITDSCTYQPA
jgi:LCP family protein required for cell wall assembly